MNEESNDQWIDKPDAVATARKGIIRYGLTRDPIVARTYEEGHPGTPLLVERLDSPGDAYYLVPWRICEGVTLVVGVDASRNAMLGATTFPTPVPSPFLTPEEALKCAAKEFPEYEFGNPRLVWQPCRESTSSSRPFYQIPYEKGAVYVDMDGKILRELTPLGRGGSYPG